MTRALYVTSLLLLAAVALTATAAPRTDVFRVPGIGDVTVYLPEGAPQQTVLFISGDGGWNLGVVAMAERLRDLGAIVAGIDIRTFIAGLNDTKTCAYPAGALEQLSQALQQRYHLPRYEAPILVGYSSGATMVYAALAAAPAETFQGGISLGFCPDLEVKAPLCEMRGLKATPRKKGIGYDFAPFPRLAVPWTVLQGESDQVCDPAATHAFVEGTGSTRLFSLPNVGHGFGVPRNWEPQFIDAYQAIATKPPPSEPPGPSAASALGDLPLIEMPADGGAHSDRLVVFLSGDGGWAELDKGVAAHLAVEGTSTVGLSSLRYFWTPRTPDETAADVSRIILHYVNAWRRPHVVLAGYSFGADVLPFVAARLSPQAREYVDSVVLLGFSRSAAFEFHVAEWAGGHAATEYATVPEAERLTVPITCVQGANDESSACEFLTGPRIRTVTVGAGHHFNGDYARLAEVINR
jgi:type IV secretory pathway VirJ component